MNFSKSQRYLLSVLSGILMVLCFPFTGSLTPLVFVAWIPLLLVESYISRQKYKSGKVFIHAYLTFFIYNIGTTWWVWNASSGGSILAFLLNTLLMAIVFYGFHLTKKYVGYKEGVFALILYWIGFEYFHYDWESSWPWLTFGNVFSIRVSWIQWYSVTGALGGTLWVLAVNLLLFRTLENVLLKKETWRIQTPLFYSAGFVLFIPLIISIITYINYEEKNNPIEVVLLQPNIDPYDKFSGISADAQLEEMIEQAESNATDKTQLIVAPETAYPLLMPEEMTERTNFYRELRALQNRIGNPSILWGTFTTREYDESQSPASYETGEGTFREEYNSSYFLDENGGNYIHKSKLVPGVEKIPFVKYFPFMAEWSIDMGGSTNGMGTEPHPKIFKSTKFDVAPVVCYESIFGGFVAEQCRLGADIICVITNDGWWKDTPGYKQHASFARLRAIENRRSVVRSANTGMSCTINQRGDMANATKWWTKDVIRTNVNLNSETTVYSKYGDVLGRSFGFVSIFLLLFTFVKRFKKLFSR